MRPRSSSSVPVGTDPHVVAVDAVLCRERSALVVGPVLDPLVPVVRQRQAIVALRRRQERGGGDQRHDLDAQRERADAGVLFPAVLRADRTVLHEIAHGAANHGLDAAHARERVLLHELAGKNDGESHLVELDAGPERTAVGEAVLVPPPVIGLGGHEIGQHPSRILDLAHGHQREPRFDAIARPHQVVAARAVARLSPRHAQAGDDRARIGPVLVHFQDDRRDIGLALDFGWALGDDQLLPPILPAIDEALPDRAVAFAQARPRQGARAFRAVGEAQRQRALVRRELAEQGDVAGERLGEGPGHASVLGEVVPAVGDPDIARARPREPAIAGEAEGVVAFPGQEVLAGAGIVVHAAVAEMRRQQRIEPRALAGEAEGDEHDVAQRIGREFQLQPVAFALVHDPGQRHVGRRDGDIVEAVALDLDPAERARDDEAEIPDLRCAGRRPVDLVDDAVAQRDPDAARAERRRHHVLGARRPGRQ